MSTFSIFYFSLFLHSLYAQKPGAALDCIVSLHSFTKLLIMKMLSLREALDSRRARWCYGIFSHFLNINIFSNIKKVVSISWKVFLTLVPKHSNCKKTLLWPNGFNNQSSGIENNRDHLAKHNLSRCWWYNLFFFVSYNSTYLLSIKVFADDTSSNGIIAQAGSKQREQWWATSSMLKPVPNNGSNDKVVFLMTPL